MFELKLAVEQCWLCCRARAQCCAKPTDAASWSDGFIVGYWLLRRSAHALPCSFGIQFSPRFQAIGERCHNVVIFTAVHQATQRIDIKDAFQGLAGRLFL